MDNNFTVVAAYITSLAAILAPTITALIHSVKEYKIAKMEHTIKERLKLCENFSDSYSKCQYGADKRGYMAIFYKQSLKLATTCKHHSTRQALFTLGNAVYHHGASDITDKLYERCILLLSKEF